MATTVIAVTDPRFKESPGEEIIVEVWNDKVRPYVFPPLKFSAPLRARWIMAAMTSLGRLPHKTLANMPDLPGMRVGVNVKRKTCRFFDPLATMADGQKLWTQAKAIIDAAKNFINNSQIEKEQHFLFDCNPSELKTWLYWMRRAADSGIVKLTEGSAPLPSFEEIALMDGKTEVNQLNSMSHKRRFLEDDPDYEAPVAAASRGRQLVGAGAPAGGDGGSPAAQGAAPTGDGASASQAGDPNANQNEGGPRGGRGNGRNQGS